MGVQAADGLYRNFRWWDGGELQEMRVEGGRVVYRRPISEESPGTSDLSGKWLYPALIDCHCHILPAGLDLQKLNLAGCESRQEALDRLRDAESQLESGRWLRAVHYDQTRFPDGQHLTRFDLDSISSSRPILIRHVSGHASVANTACLAAAEIGRQTPDPSGGTYRRDPSGDPDGVLLESASEYVTSLAPQPTNEEMVDAILRISERMASEGIGAASDMMTGRFGLEAELKAYGEAARRGCKIRLRLYVQWADAFGARAKPRNLWPEWLGTVEPERCKVAGIKIFSDGAIGSATAAIYGKYSGAPINPAMIISRRSTAAVREREDVSGQLIYEPSRLAEMVRIAHESGDNLAIHAIGDYASDVVMDAYGKLDDLSRHRIEHAMLLSDAQIERMAKLGIRCSMQPEFLLRFGHAYEKQLGQERARSIKRFRSVIDAGIPLSLSSDRPIVAGNPLDGIRAASNRPAGFDVAENLTLREAILGYTKMAADANGEGAEMGSLAPGQLADFLIHDEPIRG